MKNKYKYLLKNIGVLIISNFGSKILSFILIPIYTSVLSTSEYGTYDLYNTTISLLIPILTLNIVEAVMRFSLDNDNKQNIFSIGFKYFLRSALITIILCIFNKIFNIIPIFNTYFIYFILMFFSQVLYDLLTQFSRGIEKINKVAIAGFINSISIVILNIIMLIIFKTGLHGYFIANILGCIIPSIYLFFSLKIWNYIDFKNNKTNEKQMIEYSKPLIFNTIGWWLTNVSDRYIITLICGVASNGIYSISYKIPSLLNIFQSIFNQAWTISAVKEFNNNNNNKFYANIYNIYNCSMVIVCSILIISNKLIASLLFGKEFYQAWIYAPFLMISVVFGAMSGLMGGIFCASKDSKIFAKTTLIGAITNLVLNYILVKKFGPIGAAISTLIAYIIVWILRYFKTKKIIEFKINLIRDIMSYIILIVQTIILYLKFKYTYLLEVILFIIILIQYWKTILQILKELLKKVKVMKNV